MGAREFIVFLQQAFGGRVEMRHDTPEGTVRHAVVRIGDAALEIGEGGEGIGAPASFYLYVEDSAVYAQALRAGAASLYAPGVAYGERIGGISDARGNEWYIAAHGSPT